jgi:hypothetical protein
VAFTLESILNTRPDTNRLTVSGGAEVPHRAGGVHPRAELVVAHENFIRERQQNRRMRAARGTDERIERRCDARLRQIQAPDERAQMNSRRERFSRCATPLYRYILMICRIARRGGMDPRIGAGRLARVDTHSTIGSRLHGHDKVVAFVDRLEKSNIHRAAVEPFRTEVFCRGRGHVTVYGDARNQTTSESVSGRDGVMVDLVFRIGRRVHGANAKRKSHVYLGPRNSGQSESAERARSAMKDMARFIVFQCIDNPSSENARRDERQVSISVAIRAAVPDQPRERTSQKQSPGPRAEFRRPLDAGDCRANFRVRHPTGNNITARPAGTRPRGRVRSLHLGTYFETEVRHAGRRYFDMGLTAIVEVEGSAPDLPNLVMLTTKPAIPLSIHQLTSCGVYETVAAKIVEVDSPGVTAVNPERFVFKNVRRPMFGL